MNQRLITVGMAALLGLSPCAAAMGQGTTADSLQLPELVHRALGADPRQRLVQLHGSESTLRDQNIKAGYLPSLSVVGQAQYNSDVFTFPFQLPGGQPVPRVRKDSYDASVRVNQTVFDPAIGLRRAVERAALATSQAEVAAALYAIRGQVEQAFFAAAMSEQRQAELSVTITGLKSRLAEAGSRFRAGTALPGDTAMIAASILERQQEVLQVAADRRAALARLSVLVGAPVGDGVSLVLPEQDAAAQAVRGVVDTTTARPEFALYAAQREKLNRQSLAERAALWPKLSLFGRLGYGLPGLNPLNTTFDAYWTIGAQVSWAPFDWGSTHRRREALDIEREISSVNQAAFARDLRLSVQSDLATIDRLAAALVLDDQIVTLRETTEHEARIRLAEGAVTTAEYVDRNSELLAARLDRAQHRVERARTEAELLTLLGAETR